MITIKETTKNEISNVKELWADGDVMKFVGFPDGLHETDENMEEWFDWISSVRPTANHYSIFNEDIYCGEAFYEIDIEHDNSAALDIKLFKFARGKGIATKALTYAMEEAFKNGAKKVWVDPNPDNVKAVALYERLGFVHKPMPEHLLDEDGTTSIYMEIIRTEQM